MKIPQPPPCSSTVDKTVELARARDCFSTFDFSARTRRKINVANNTEQDNIKALLGEYLVEKERERESLPKTQCSIFISTL